MNTHLHDLGGDMDTIRTLKGQKDRHNRGLLVAFFA
jgi:hypothetical protein